MSETGRRPVLILVQGMPGTGKTTLSRKLAADTGLPLVSKDDLKEYFFDKIGTRDRNWSRAIGRAVSEMLYLLVDSMLAEGYDLMVESAFFVEFAQPEFAKIIDKYHVRCLEVYCQVDPEERRRRFIDRVESGQRHVGHVDALNYDDLDDERDSQTYGPLQVGQLRRVDTMTFGDAEYAVLLHDVESFIKG